MLSLYRFYYIEDVSNRLRTFKYNPLQSINIFVLNA
nr:MAG TPA: hypothetical protein [Caudoviricetes sp.]